MTIEQIRELMRQQNGKIFGVTFRTKDNRWRNMSCRLGVRKGVKGVQNRHEQDDLFGLVTVYDFNADWKANDKKGGFRRINLDTLIRIQIQGKEIRI